METNNKEIRKEKTWSNNELNWELITSELYQNVSSDSKEAWLLWQDPTFIGFIKIGIQDFNDQPNNPDDLDFSLLQDLRLVGPKGEWHIWRIADGTLKGRFISDSVPIDYIEEDYLLWGTDKANSSEHPGWTLVYEERGMKLWLPWESTELPAKIKVRHLIKQDEASGLAAIMDSMLKMTPQE